MEHPHAKLLKRFIKDTTLIAERYMVYDNCWGLTQWKTVAEDTGGKYQLRIRSDQKANKSKHQQDFEAWYGTEYSDYALKTWDGVRYQNLDTEMAWQAWQAGSKFPWNAS